MPTSIAPSALAPSGLTEAQRLHFTEHGWVLLEGVLGPDECERYIDSIDYTLSKFEAPALAKFQAPAGDPNRYDVGDRRGFAEPHLRDARFADIYEIPGVFEAARQLIGFDDVRYGNSLATSTWPSEGDAATRQELADASKFSWHRDLPPRCNVLPDPNDARFVISLTVTMVVFFTPAAEDLGATALLDGSHRIEGEWRNTPDVWAALGERCPVVYPEGPAGSIVLFSESLVHAARPILGDQRRVCMFSWFNAPWMAGDHGQPPHMIERYANERMRAFFQGPEAGAFFSVNPDAKDEEEVDETSS